MGLLVAVLLLHSREQDIDARYAANAERATYEIAEVLRRVDWAPFHDPQQRLVEDYLNDIRTDFRFSALRLEQGRRHIDSGAPTGDVKTLSQKIVTAGRPGFQLIFYLPDYGRAARDMRNRTLLAVGALVFVFALILQKVLQNLLSKPFGEMVASANAFAEGNTAARFDESRRDEFGFLASFINRALDSVVEKQRDLQHALKQANRAEAALSNEKERAEVTLNSITDAVITTDEQGRVQYMNPAAVRLLGWGVLEALGRPLEEIARLHRENSDIVIPDPVQECLRTGNVVTVSRHAVLVRHNDTEIAIEANAAPMRNQEGEIIGAVAVFQDVSHARRLTRQLTYQASHDLVTGLYNRRKFEELLDSALVSAQEEDHHHALCYLDLDQFKLVNDTCGHQAGDELLKQLSILLRESLREGDVLARLGGDEFGVLLENCPLQEAVQVADKLRQAIRDTRFVWEGKGFEIGVSVGVVPITALSDNLASLMSAADVACYAAKDSGRNRVHVYEATDELLARRQGEMQWVSRISNALKDNRLQLYRQPIRPLSHEADEEGEHWEILLRMIDEDGRTILPHAFLPAAERYDLMPAIDRWVVHSTFEALKAGCCHGQPTRRRVVTINLSGASLNDEGLYHYIRSAGEEFGIDFGEICFEVTETVAISNLVKARQLMQELRALGCRFALDDFGSGLSSFGYLKNLPVDYLKIDGAFVKDMLSDPVDREMVAAVTRLGHVMRIRTIAEWVEDEAVIPLLQELGVDYAQGYALGQPRRMTDPVEV
ncbi:MAG: EAL domain-containing protein [Gammaproteobacteria bacterium]